MRTATPKWWRIFAILCAICLTAAACGSDDETSATTEADSGAETTEAMEDEDEESPDTTAAMEEAGLISDECAIPNPAEVQEIDVMGWEFPIIEQYAKEFEDCEEGNYSFNLQFLDSSAAQDAMRLDGASGSPEFELYQGSNSFIVEMANTGALMPLNDLIEKYSDEYGLADIDDAFWDFMSIDGNIYAVPMVSNTMHLFYNETILNEIGVEVPTTFEEALATCAPIQEAGYDAGFFYNLSANWSWRIEFDSVLGSLGVDPIDEATGQPNFNSPEGIQAANTLKSFLDDCGGNTAATYSLDDMQAGFQTGEIILGHTWASRAGAMDDPEASTVVGEIQYAPALSGGVKLASPAYVDGWGIPVGADGDIDALFLAIIAAADLESQEAAAEFGLVTRAGVTNPNGPRNAAAAEASLVNGKGPDLGSAAAAIARAQLGDALIKILDGTSVEDALAEAEAAYLEEAEAQGLLS